MLSFKKLEDILGTTIKWELQMKKIQLSKIVNFMVSYFSLNLG